MRHYNTVIYTFNTDPSAFEPVFWRGGHWGAAEWCEGFLLGFQFNEKAWTQLAIGQPTWFTPFLRLASEEGIEITKRTNDAEKWMNEIEPSLIKIQAYWNNKRGEQPAGAVQPGF